MFSAYSISHTVIAAAVRPSDVVEEGLIFCYGSSSLTDV